ncbi:MAG: type II secretion system protein, partial [Deltaproteobacteria bacterium]|nr:type II secretion system protein [Deltaproteobacteria bacterium]
MAHRFFNNKAFTLVEVLMASIIVAFVAAGIWGVYWS